MNRLYFLEVAPVPEGIAYNGMLPYVSDHKKEMLSKGRFEIDIKIRVCADILLRCLLAGLSGRKLAELDLREAEYGKPYLAGAPGGPRLEFSLSHTRNAVAVALSDKPVGVDIERRRTFDLNIARHVYSQNELTWINEPGADRTLRFFEIWTKKEAYLKYEGTGLTGGLKALDILGRQGPPAISTLHTGDYVVSVCADEKYAPDDLTRLTEARLYDIWQECVC